MKKMMALVSLLVVGLLVGCGGKPKPVVSDPNKVMNDMKKAAAGDLSKMTEEAKKIGEVPGGVEKAASEGVEKAVEKDKNAVEEGTKAVEEGAKKAEGAAEKPVEAVKKAAGDK